MMRRGTSNIEHRTPNIERFARRIPRTLDVWKSVLAAVVVLELLAKTAFAAGQLRADLIPLGLRARSAAPIPVEARFNWDGTRILEGRLEMEFHEGGRVLGRYRSGELALPGGEQDFRMLLPPLLMPFSDSQVEVQMKFATAGNEVELMPSILFVPTSSERSLVVAWCAPLGIGGWQNSGIERNLLVERLAPAAPDTASQKLLTTSVARIAPEDLPAQPLAYTPFDVVVLTAEAFKQAGKRQLEALARWTRGGGSTCLYVGRGLQSQHIEFLNELSDSAPGGPVFQADETGNLVPGGKEISMLRSGLGRSVIVPEAIVADLNTNASVCRKAAAFLWKMRSDQADAVTTQGHWNEPTNLPVINYNSVIRSRPGNRLLPAAQNAPQYTEPLSFSVQPSPLGAELMNRLMPRTVRLIPFSSLLGMLVLFLLMIGPVDYFVLGFIRRRRLTWVLFPATSIAFMAATVLMANHYLGLRDQRRSLTVVDLAADGTALRWNRYELIFAARDKQSSTDLKDALWAPLTVQAMPMQPYVQQVIRGRRVLIGPNNSGYMPINYSQVETEPPLYEGTLPVRYDSREMIHQWQPKLNRSFSFEPPPVPLPPNWKAVEAAWPNLQKIRAALSEKQPFSGDIYEIYGAPIASGPPSIKSDPGSTGIFPASILQELCTGESQGWLSLVSQISPTGGGNFEDVQAMDLEDGDTALVIVTRRGDDVVVYRRFFYGN